MDSFAVRIAVLYIVCGVREEERGGREMERGPIWLCLFI